MQTKDVQGKLWSTAPADWAKYLEPTFIPLYQGALSHLKLDDEKMLLDAGCGSGLFLSMAETTGAIVYGVDAAPGMLEIAKKRLRGVSLLTGDLEALPFIDGTFDVVTGFNSFQYAASFQSALNEASHVVKRHGKVVIGIWGKEEECETAQVLNDILSLLPAPLSGAPGPYEFSEEGKVEGFCQQAGLKVLHKQTVFCPWLFADDEALVKGFLCTAPCVKAVQHTSLETVTNTILSSAERYCITDNLYYLRNHLTLFITEKL